MRVRRDSELAIQQRFWIPSDNVVPEPSEQVTRRLRISVGIKAPYIRLVHVWPTLSIKLTPADYSILVVCIVESNSRQLAGRAGLDQRIEVIEGFPELRRRGGTGRVDLVAEHKPDDGGVVAVFFRQPFRSVAVELAKVRFAFCRGITVHQIEWDRQADPDVDWVHAIVPQLVEEGLVRRVLQGVKGPLVRIAELVVSFVVYTEIEQLPEIG